MGRTWQIIAATIGIFIAGLVTGGAVTLRTVHLLHGRRIQAEAEGRVRDNPPSTAIPGGALPAAAPSTVEAAPTSPQRRYVPPFGPNPMRRLVLNRLDLSDAQRKEIGLILGRANQELGRLRNEAIRSTGEVNERMRSEITAILTPEQKGKFEILIEQSRARLQMSNADKERERVEREKGRSAYGNPSAPAPSASPLSPASGEAAK
jgi:hypothetical protein